VSLDLRSLAVFRIGLGLLLLADLFVRSGDLTAHYTDAGVLPRDVVPASATCLHGLDGSWAFQAALFLVAGLFALALLVGWHTRLATFASCFLLISLHARNPLVIDGGDVLLRVLLFWGIFLPLGARWSLDRARSPEPPPPPCVTSVATTALLLQVCFVYWFSALLKSDPSWRTDGTAVYYALSLEPFATRMGRHLLAYPDLLRLFTLATFWLEALGPALLFVPYGQGPLRTFAVAGFGLFHLLGLNLTLELGHFPYVCAVAWLALLPTWFWDRIMPRSPERLGAPPGGGVPETIATPVWMQVMAGVLLIYVFFWNVRTIDFERFEPLLPQRLNWLGEGLGLGQSWGMFAPYPSKESGWYVIVGTREDGRQVDLFTGGGPVRWDRPELVSATFKNTRWRKYLMNLAQLEHARYRDGYARYLCGQWNAAHIGGERLKSVEVYFMLAITLPNDQASPRHRVLLGTHVCGGTGPGSR
jgi:hypothetical protein